MNNNSISNNNNKKSVQFYIGDSPDKMSLEDLQPSGSGLQAIETSMVNPNNFPEPPNYAPILSMKKMRRLDGLGTTSVNRNKKLPDIPYTRECETQTNTPTQTRHRRFWSKALTCFPCTAKSRRM